MKHPSSQGEQALYIDAGFFCGYLFPNVRDWPLHDARRRVGEVREALLSARYDEPVFFFDDFRGEEEESKWLHRCKRALKQEERRVPPSVTGLVAELVREAGMRALWSSAAPNDDTLAAFAHRDRAFILSADKDMFRCRVDQRSTCPTYRVYKYLKFKNGRGFLVPTPPLLSDGPQRPARKANRYAAPLQPTPTRERVYGEHG